LEGRPLLSALYLDLRPLHNSFSFTDANGGTGALSLTGTPKGADNGQVLVTYKTVGSNNYLSSVQILDSPNPNFSLTFSSKMGPGRSLILPQITASAAGAYNGIVTNGPGVNFVLTSYAGAEPLGPTGSINVGDVMGPLTVALKTGQSLRTGNILSKGAVTITPAWPAASIGGTAILGNVSGALQVNGPLGSTARVNVNSESSTGSMTFNGSLGSGAVVASNGDLAGTVTINGNDYGTVNALGSLKALTVNGDAGYGSVVQASGDAKVSVFYGNEYGAVKARNLTLSVSRNPSTGAGGNVYAGSVITSTAAQTLTTDGNFGGVDHSSGALTATIGSPSSDEDSRPGSVLSTATFIGESAQNLTVSGSFNGAVLGGDVTMSVGSNVGSTASLISDGTMSVNVPGRFDGQIRANRLGLQVGGNVGCVARSSTIVAKDVTSFSVGGDFDGVLNVTNSFDPGGSSATPVVVAGDMNGEMSIPSPTNPSLFQLVFGGDVSGNLLIANPLSSDLVIQGDLTGGLTVHGDVGASAANTTILVAGDFTGYVNTPDAFKYDSTTDNYWFYDVNGNVIGNLAVGGNATGQVNLRQS
jgi:hypothetical protein